MIENLNLKDKDDTHQPRVKGSMYCLRMLKITLLCLMLVENSDEIHTA